MATRNMSYDAPAYLARLEHAFGQNAAGASTNFSKFVAFTNLQIFSVNALGITNGTSTYTAWNGSSTTVGVNGDQFSVIRVTNTATALNIAPALSTTTYGPYALALTTAASATSTNTTTGAAGVLNNIPLSQTGIALATAAGGFSINQGDSIHIVRGTDATAVSAFAIEYGIQPLANVTA